MNKLTRNVRKEHLHEIFSNFGRVLTVEVPANSVHPEFPKGYAYVEFAEKSDAESAVREMDGGQVDGQVIRCECVLVPISRDHRPREKRHSRTRCAWRFNSAFTNTVTLIVHLHFELLKLKHYSSNFYFQLQSTCILYTYICHIESLIIVEYPTITIESMIMDMPSPWRL